MKANHAIDFAKGQDNFNFNNSLLSVTENELTDVIFMFAKIGQHMKASSLISHKILLDTCISIENNKVVDVGGPSQKAIDDCSRKKTIFFTVLPNFSLRNEFTSFNRRHSTNPQNKKHDFFMHCRNFLCAIALGKFTSTS